MEINKEVIFDAISKLSNKVDAIASTINVKPDNRLDAETLAVITAVAYNLFGRRASIHSVKLLK